MWGSPWNLEFSGAAQVDSNSNIYYDPDNEISDIVVHVIPGIKLEYVKLENVLFEGSLKIDYHAYLDNSDIDFLGINLHAQMRPVHAGAYAIFAEDLHYTQTYSNLAGTLAETAVNIIEAGGGYRGYHLDLAGSVQLELSAGQNTCLIRFTFLEEWK
jgi:hypothetical protein